jgi:ABC-type transport system involved in cytochrome bd biosynthesis fused ATPase/permease subunit
VTVEFVFALEQLLRLGIAVGAVVIVAAVGLLGFNAWVWWNNRSKP